LTIIRKSRQNPDVREFILRNVKGHPEGISLLAAQKFGLSRQAVSAYLTRLVKDDLLIASGNTRARRYDRKPLYEDSFSVKLSHGMADDVIWRARVLPNLKGNPSNVLDICQYGFTEIFSNCADHSISDFAHIRIVLYYDEITIYIADDGVGIFEKIMTAFNLTDPRHALLELSKGKLTSDPTRHTGEGIFFTSRMFNEFTIMSGHLYYSKKLTGDARDHEWLIETDDFLKKQIGQISRARQHKFP
jgi:anti-sigma regulatory factor (Ser/Thr protein kinase)